MRSRVRLVIASTMRANTNGSTAQMIMLYHSIWVGNAMPGILSEPRSTPPSGGPAMSPNTMPMPVRMSVTLLT